MNLIELFDLFLHHSSVVDQKLVLYYVYGVDYKLKTFLKN